MITFKDLKEKYSNLPEKKLTPKEQLELLNTPELAEMYISSYNLSDETDPELISTPELIEKYIDEWDEQQLKKIINNNL